MRLSELCEVLTQAGFPAQLDGDDRAVRAVNTLEDASEGEITFLSNPKYLQAVQSTKASAVIVKEDIDVPPSVAAVAGMIRLPRVEVLLPRSKWRLFFRTPKN